MSKIEKTIWIVMHIVCICILAFCVWKNKELFPETVAMAEKNMTQEESRQTDETPPLTETPGITAEPVPTKAITATLYPEPTPETLPDTTPEATPAVTPVITSPPEPEPEENADPVKDKMGDDLVTELPTPEATPEPEKGLYTELRTEIEEKIMQGVYQELDNKQEDWWFVRKKEHVPSGSGEAFDISAYDAYYLNKNVEDGDKVIYLTFDCGYENGFTPQILDTLAVHHAQAMFFVTKSFIETCPQYVIRMKEEGHLVGNHTLNHPVMPSKDETTLMNEIIGCAELFYETTGYEMDPFLRPPTGAYSRRTLQLTKDLGYTTIFWSIAYKDYDVKNQPGKEYVVDHFTTYYHNGAIPLIHNISQSNTEALDEVLTLLEAAGYRFGSLMELRQ